jgi:hypothetical protein
MDGNWQMFNAFMARRGNFKGNEYVSLNLLCTFVTVDKVNSYYDYASYVGGQLIGEQG